MRTSIVKKVNKLVGQLEQDAKHLDKQADNYSQEASRLITESNVANKEAGQSRSLATALRGALGGAK